MRPLRLEVWDWDRNGSHDLIGRVSTSLQGLLQGQGHELALEVSLSAGPNFLPLHTAANPFICQCYPPAELAPRPLSEKSNSGTHQRVLRGYRDTVEEVDH